MGRIGSGGSFRIEREAPAAGRTAGAVGGVGGLSPGAIGANVSPELFAEAFTPVVKVTVADNTPFIDRVDTDKLLDDLIRPTKTIVVSQTPAAGEQVPLGTPISVTMTVKGSIPTNTLDIDPKVVDTFGTIGALEDAVVNFDNAADLQDILLSGSAYDDLSQSDRGVVNDFLGNVGDFGENERAGAFNDIGFMFNL